MKLLEGKVAIITGSGTGIGRADALLMARHGARVVVNDVDEGLARATVADIMAEGGEAMACVGSVTEADFPDRLVGAALDTFHRLDILVNNAGFVWDGFIHKMTDEQWQAVIDVHLKAPFRIIRAASGYLRETAKQEIEEGKMVHRKIINVSSTSGVAGNAGQANYASAKMGIVGLTKGLAKEWGRFNINVNAVCYGFIETRMTAPREEQQPVHVGGGREVVMGVPRERRESMVPLIPLGRPGTPEDAAGPVLFLASPLSDYVTGVTLLVTGGLYM